MNKKLEFVADAPPYSIAYSGVFCNSAVKFMISDDILVSQFSIVELLKWLLVSDTPLTDVFLGVRDEKDKLPVDIQPPLRPKCDETETPTGSTRKITLKLHVKEDEETTFFAEADNDFADLLFGFLTYPMGAVIKKLGGHSGIRCMDNLYNSVEALKTANCFNNNGLIGKLLNPKLPPFFKAENQLIKLDEETQTQSYFTCSDASYHNSSKVGNIRCAHYHSKYRQLNPTDPKCGFKDDPSIAGGYLRISKYMVTDNLVIRQPSSHIVITGILRKDDARKGIDSLKGGIHAKNVEIGEHEALALFQASITSKKCAHRCFTGGGKRRQAPVHKTMAITAGALTAMKFDSGFDIDFDSFDGSPQHFLDILNLFKEQQLVHFMSTRIPLLESEIKEWCLTTIVSDNNSLTGKISGNEVAISPQVITEAFNFAAGDDDIELSVEEYTLMLDRMGHAAGNPSKLLKINLAIEYRLLADITGKVICVKRTAHDAITRHQFCLMAALLDKKHPNWGLIVFEMLKKKLDKNSVHFGRVLGLILNHCCPQLLVSSKKHINASKRLTCALIGKWDRRIVNPRAAAAMKSSADTRTVEVSHPQYTGPEVGTMPAPSLTLPSTFIPSTIIISSTQTLLSSISTIASSLPPLTTFLPINLDSTPHEDLFSFDMHEDSFMDASTSSPHDFLHPSTFSDLLFSSIQEPVTPPLSTPPSTSSTFSVSATPSTSTQVPLEQSYRVLLKPSTIKCAGKSSRFPEIVKGRSLAVGDASIACTTRRSEASQEMVPEITGVRPCRRWGESGRLG
ncbi:hypothetical protein KSP39_PZI004852 [Platanthera zijinensis]|uniref:Uncharacterized protein n=1 Tax=Platanthera zijinensis TaxID=2320716 RepID=A0AAP0GD13_9ASPA